MSIRVEGLTKLYDGRGAVSDLTLEVAEGEMCVLLGPSGSGKSTVLRMIAGLTAVDGGSVVLHGKDVTHLPPQVRDIGFVFQSYALFGHMTVAENVAFALTVRGVRRAERRRRCEELLDLVGLSGFGARMPRQLSGGQQQRVALARALAHRPRVLLLDEPFGALDARIRTELRRSLLAIQRELGLTALFVTHDQEEAFELADRIAVMAGGRLMEVGPPHELYARPRTEFVATFLGSTNLIVGETTRDGVRVGPVELPLATQGAAGRRVQVLFRPEDVSLAPAAAAGSGLGVGVVERAAFCGAVEHLRLRLPPFVGVRPIAPPVPFGADYFLVEATRSPHESLRLPLHPGDRASVGVRRVHVLSHPGLSFLVAADASPEGQAALALGGELARRAHARVTLVACAPERPGEELARARQRIGPAVDGLEGLAFAGALPQGAAWGALRSPSDLVILGVPPADRARAGAQCLAGGRHHLLLAGRATEVPRSVLICSAVGEPGKHDVAFAGRLVRHLGAEATVLTVLPEDASQADRELAERFLQGSIRTLAPLGVPARSLLRAGSAEDEIVRGLEGAGKPTLLVLGAPLPGSDGAIHLGGPVGRILARTGEVPVLVVRGSLGRS